MTPLAPVPTYDLVAELARRFATPSSALLLLASHLEADCVRVDTILGASGNPDLWQLLAAKAAVEVASPLEDPMGVVITFEEVHADTRK